LTGTVREPVYAHDRIVIPAGTRVRGHVSAIDSRSKLSARAYLSGNLSPNKHAVLQFDTLLLDEDVEYQPRNIRRSADLCLVAA
jgi:hypothetical protein